MSMYLGQTAGIKYNNQLKLEKQRREERQRMGRYGGYGRPYQQNVPMESEQQSVPLPTEPPRHWGERVAGGPASQSSKAELEKLPDLIKHAVMGMPERGEQVYNGNGDHKVKSKSTSFDPASGTVTTVDAETGKTLTVPKHIVDSIMGFASAKPSSEKDQAAIRKSEAEIGKIEAQRAAIEAGKPTDPKVAFQLDQARKDQEAEIRKAEYALRQAQKAYWAVAGDKPNLTNKDVENDIAAKKQAFEDATFAAQEARKRYGLDTTPPPGVATVNPQQQHPQPQAPGYGGNTVNIKGGNIGAAANPTHDAYNYLDSVIKSGKHPKTGQPLTPAQMMLAKQKMAALKNQMLGKK